MTAFRFYRRDEIPRIKDEHPEMEGRQRHSLVKHRWKLMSQDDKFPFVLMSRADEERAKYMSKVAQIRNNLLSEAKNWTMSSMVTDVFTRLTKVIDSEKGDPSEESSCSESLREMVEESKVSEDLSLSLINRQIGSEECSQVLSEEVLV